MCMSGPILLIESTDSMISSTIELFAKFETDHAVHLRASMHAL